MEPVENEEKSEAKVSFEELVEMVIAEELRRIEGVGVESLEM